MISCEEAVRQLWEYLDGIVDAADRERVEEHLAFCLRCCGAADFAGELASFLSSHASDDVPEPVRARLLATLEDIA